MTTTVRKGSGRPAAAAKGNRHAQRTILPRRAARATETDATPEPKGESTGTAVLAGASKSEPKAKAFAVAVESQGWSAKIESAPGTSGADDVVELTAKRGSEVLWISWTRGTLTTTPMPTYTIEDRTIQLRNASAAKQYAARAPEVARDELNRVAANRAFRPKERAPKKSRLPFDPALATDLEVIEILAGRKVVWHNSISQMEEEAVVGPDHRRIEVVEATGNDRIVKFCCPASGFRAFKLSALVRVGGTITIEKRSGGRKVSSNRKAK